MTLDIHYGGFFSLPEKKMIEKTTNTDIPVIQHQVYEQHII